MTEALLHGVQFERNLDENAVEWAARILIEQTLADLTPAEAYEAGTQALRSDVQLTDSIPQPHTEQQFRDFLGQVLERMDAMRPWPEPPVRRLSQSLWTFFKSASPIARIGMDEMDVQERLRKVFISVEEGDRRRYVLVLRLKSGHEVALATPWWEGSKDVAVLPRDQQHSPQQVLAAFLDATDFTTDDVADLSHGSELGPRNA